MRVLERLESRRQHWQELERLCGDLEGGWRRFPAAANVSHFADLYRSACSDLALADAYQLPTTTIQYLHQLVGRAHNQLYRHEARGAGGWFREVFVRVPQRLYADGCLRLAFALFWGVFLLCMFLAWRDPDSAARLVGREALLQRERQFADAYQPQTDERAAMAGFYLRHNATIGLRCFAFGLLAGVGGLYETVFNASFLGAEFGYMTRSPSAANFFTFVTAHGPFELTAVVLMAAAGMRLGFSLIDTRGRSRGDAMRRAARRSVPVILVGLALFLLAAGIEAFVSPFATPYAVKAGVAVFSAVLLFAYFIVLGYPGRTDDADHHRIVIRERGRRELLDLALRVLRSQPGPLFLAFLAGAAPFIVLNAWLLNRFATVAADGAAPWTFLALMLVAVLWELPLATAPATLCLGRSLFFQPLESRVVGREFVQSLPQLIYYQVLLRGLLMASVVGSLVPLSATPYLNEVILLERNPLRDKGKKSLPTGQRSSMLHRGQGGDFFVNWILKTVLGAALVAAIWGSLALAADCLLSEENWSGPFYTVAYPAALWIVVAYFAVVRFLGYLDLRIRREGWEVELLMRAELDRWTRVPQAS